MAELAETFGCVDSVSKVPSVRVERIRLACRNCLCTLLILSQLASIETCRKFCDVTKEVL